jgi:hypothetical protein
MLALLQPQTNPRLQQQRRTGDLAQKAYAINARE